MAYFKDIELGSYFSVYPLETRQANKNWACFQKISDKEAIRFTPLNLVVIDEYEGAFLLTEEDILYWIKEIAPIRQSYI